MTSITTSTDETPAPDRYPAGNCAPFNRYMAAQAFSGVGTYMQYTAIAWAALVLSRSAGVLGVVTACQAFPILVLAGHGGWLSDRYRRASILACTALMSAVTTGTIGLLVLLTGDHEYLLVTLGVLDGAIAAIESPARQSFIRDLVGADRLHASLSRYQAVFSIARLAGPAIAGFLLEIANVDVVLLINAASFLGPAALMLTFWRRGIGGQGSPERARGGYFAGFSLVARDSRLSRLVVCSLALGALIMQYAVTNSVMVRNVLHLGPYAVGWADSSLALGAILGGLLGAQRFRFAHRMTVFAWALTGLVSYLAPALFPALWLLLAGQAVLGVAIVRCTVGISAQLQAIAPAPIRGRVLAVNSMVFIGLAPVGALLAGFISAAMGPRIAITILSALALLTLALGTCRRRRTATS